MSKSPRKPAPAPTGTAPSSGRCWSQHQAQHSYYSPVSSPAVYPFIITLFILSPACARQHRVHATQKPCRARFWAQRRACGLELDISDEGRIQGRGHCNMSPLLAPKAPRALVGALDGSKAMEGGFDSQGRSSLSSAAAPSLGRSSEGTLEP